MEIPKVRNFEIDQEESLEYKHGKIRAYRESWEEFDDKKEKWNKKKNYVCHLLRNGTNLNLGGCNDGGNFSAVSQAINEAKWLVDYDLEKLVEQKLRAIGYKNEDFFKYNSLKIWERLEEKEKLTKIVKEFTDSSHLRNLLVEKELQRRDIAQLMHIAKYKVGVKQLLVEFLTDKKIKY